MNTVLMRMLQLAPVHVVKRVDGFYVTWTLTINGVYQNAIGVADEPYAAMGRAWTKAVQQGWVKP